ncbi:MAG: amino acid permease [Acidobacteria bacterium]|nr:amino acid permease [Acidobacteriota bacterium]
MGYTATSVIPAKAGIQTVVAVNRGTGFRRRLLSFPRRRELAVSLGFGTGTFCVTTLQAGLARQLGTLSATALVVSNMIGVGIFTTTGFLAGDIGRPTLVIGIWFVGAALALAGALCYSELGMNFPRSGGEYVYLSEAWGPAWGFIDGWISFFAGFSAPIGAAALAVSAYLAYFFPSLSADSSAGVVVPLGFAHLRLGGAQFVACGIVLAFTAINLINVSRVAKLQIVLTATKLVVIGIFLVLGFSVGNGDWAHFAEDAERTVTSPLAAQFAVSLIFVFYAYSGWNAAVYVAEEIRSPERTLPIALGLGTLFVATLYAALNVLYIYANSLDEMKGVVAVGAQAARSLFGDRAGGLFSGAMAVSLLATINAMCMIGPRVYYAMARNGAFFAAAAKVHPRWDSPWMAVLAQGTCCCLLILTGTFESLGYYIGFTLFLFTALSVLALFKFRKRPGWRRSRWVNIGYPLIPLTYVSMNIWVFVYFARLKGWEALWSLLTVVGGALSYSLYFRKRPMPVPEES